MEQVRRADQCRRRRYLRLEGCIGDRVARLGGKTFPQQRRWVPRQQSAVGGKGFRRGPGACAAPQERRLGRLALDSQVPR